MAGGKLAYRLIGMAFAVPTSLAVKKALDAGWRRSRGADPPKNPKAPDIAWTDALAWAAISAMAVTAGQVAASRGAVIVYRTLTGREPPGSEPRDQSNHLDR